LFLNDEIYFIFDSKIGTRINRRWFTTGGQCCKYFTVVIYSCNFRPWQNKLSCLEITLHKDLNCTHRGCNVSNFETIANYNCKIVYSTPTHPSQGLKGLICNDENKNKLIDTYPIVESFVSKSISIILNSIVLWGHISLSGLYLGQAFWIEIYNFKW